ncbi:MAG: hypothetical protein K8H84_08765 [Sulfuricella denitrificans]|nr:hypothetical protein [Sulfuricella denitrificans]
MPVLINNKQYLPDFIRLNEAWIARYFRIEEADRELARNPAKIIADGLQARMTVPNVEKIVANQKKGIVTDHWHLSHGDFKKIFA